MNLLFLVPLFIALIAAYLFQKTTQEIAYLTGTITAISLIISLIVAPWQLQLVIVIIALLLARQLWQQLNAIETPVEILNTSDKSSELSQSLTAPEPEEDKSDKKYGGLTYQKGAPVTVERKYRGHVVKVQEVSPNLIIKQKSNLKYRGITIAQESADEKT
jgi:hypothetical protein